jgi:hypothetical protein
LDVATEAASLAAAYSITVGEVYDNIISRINAGVSSYEYALNEMAYDASYLLEDPLLDVISNITGTSDLNLPYNSIAYMASEAAVAAFPWNHAKDYAGNMYYERNGLAYWVEQMQTYGISWLEQSPSKK